jgi:hypothetical protein
MADNVAITAGSGTTIAADDIGAGVLVQRVKTTWGPDGTANDADVASGKPLPIQHRVSDGTAWTYGSGAIGAGTPRIALATDSPGIIATGTAGTPSAVVLSVQGVASGTVIPTTNTALTNFGAGEYETVAASQTAQALGATGATGDYISGILVIPATTSPGVVTLLDNATSIPVFVGGASSVSNLVPFFIPLGMISVSGAWKITTGANVSCIGIGNFT